MLHSTTTNKTKKRQSMSSKRITCILFASFSSRTLASGPLTQSKGSPPLFLFICEGELICHAKGGTAQITKAHFIHEENYGAYTTEKMRTKGVRWLSPPLLSQQGERIFFIAWLASWEKDLQDPKKITKMIFSRFEHKQHKPYMPIAIQQNYSFDWCLGV